MLVTTILARTSGSAARGASREYASLTVAELTKLPTMLPAEVPIVRSTFSKSTPWFLASIQ